MAKHKTRKKQSKAAHYRRQMIGARICFDGDEEAGQVAEFRDGTQFNEKAIDFLIRHEWKWNIEITFVFKNDIGFKRETTRMFVISDPCRFNSLKDYADELATMAGLDQPEGYKFHLNTWKARVTG